MPQPSDYPKSLALQEHAKKRIPGMTQLLSKRPDQFSLGVWPGYFSRARGAEVWDLDGNRYLDMSISGIGANILGYADPDVDGAVKEAIERGTTCSLNCPEEVALADMLCDIHPWAEKVRFARTGGESMAIAVRIARAHTGRDKVAFCGYHGWHDWYLAANVGTENALGEHLLQGLDPAGVPRSLKGTALPFRYNHLEELQEVVAREKHNLAAVILEPIRGNYPQPGFLEGVRELTDETGAVLIMDEISAGFRLCLGGAHLKLNTAPDIAVFSKAMGNGYPIGAVIGRAEIMEAAQRTFISSTCWTERTGFTAAIATMQKYRACDVSTHLSAIGSRVQQGWKALAAKHDVDITVGGLAPCGHFIFNYDNALSLKALFIQLMLEQGFLASNLLYVMLAHTPGHVQQYLDAADAAFASLAAHRRQGTVDAALLGKPSSTGFRRLT